MGKIGWGQFGIILALSRIFAEAANFPSDDINYGMQRFTVLVLSYILLAVVVTPVFILVKKRQGYNAVSAAAEKSPVLAKIFAVLFIIVLITMMSTTLVQLEFYASSTIFDAAPAWLLILFFLAVCLYGTHKGLSAVARTGVIAAAGFGLFLILVVIGITGDIRIEYLSPVLAEKPRLLFGQVIREFSQNSEAVVFALLCSEVREKAHLSLILYGSLSLAAILFMTFLYNTVLGEYLNVSSFPFYMLASLSDVTLFQRLDGIDAAVWTMAAILKLTLMTAAVYNAALSGFGSKKTAKLVSMISLVAASGAGLFLSYNTTDFLNISKIPETGLILFFAAALLPLISLIISRRKRQKGARI